MIYRIELNARIILAVIVLLWPAFCKPVVALQDQRLSKAARLFQQGDYQEAVEQYEQASKNGEMAFAGHLGLARVLVETGEYAKAEEVCYQALVDSPKHPDALNLLGEILKRRGRYEAARSNFQQALDSEPDHLKARLNLGIMQAEWGDNRSARQTLNEFIAYYRAHSNLSTNELRIIAQACVYLERFRDANSLFHDATTAAPDQWQTFIPWGNLFLSKYNTADAMGVFEDALKTNPNAAEAHLGLARCWAFSDFEKAQEAAEIALRINPSLVEAHNLLAELEIAIGDYNSALERLAAPLETNPNSPTARTLKAVCYFALKDEKRFSMEESAILNINPKYGSLYFEIAEFLSKRYLFKESVEYYKRALALEPENWSARAGLGTSLSRLGEEEAAKQELENAFAKDPYNKYVGNLLTLFDELPRYKTHQFRNFTIRIHERDDAILSGYVKELVGRSYTALAAKYDLEEADPVILEIFPEHDDFAVRCFGLPGAQAFLGICFGNVVAMDSPRARSKGDFVWGETLWHELVHVTHLRLTRNRIPRWLAEGIAVYETTSANPHWGMNLDMPFIQALMNNYLLHLKDLDAGFNRPRSPGQVTLSYFQAYMVVEFLIKEYGLQRLLQTFPEFKSGMETNQVFETVYRKDLEALNEEFKTYLKQKYNLNEVDYTFEPRELAANSGQLETYLQKKLQQNGNNPFLNNELGMYYKKNGEFDRAIPFLVRAKELFPNYVSGESPYKALANIYLREGQKEKAIEELTAFTALNGKDLEALDLLAELCAETQDYAGAIAALEKIIYITPFESDVHKKLASVYLANKQYNMAIAEFRTVLLTEPQDQAGAHCDLADAYLQAGKRSKAKESALAALEIAPNYLRAQEILLACVK